MVLQRGSSTEFCPCLPNVAQVARIVRIVLNDGGHALLVGVGGSGKQSLSRLAAFICGYSVSQIVISSTYSINDLKEDLKTMYNKVCVLFVSPWN